MSSQMIDPISAALDANAAAAPSPAAETTTSTQQTTDQTTAPPRDTAAQQQQTTTGAEQQTTDQQTGEQVSPEEAAAQRSSSYQRRVQELTELQTKYAEIEQWKAEREAQDGAFVGIKADQPHQNWDPLPQVQALPPGHQQKLVKSVIDNYLAPGIEEAISNPEVYGADLTRYAQATASLVEFAWGRPAQETARLMSMIAGLPSQQVEQMLIAGGQTLQSGGTGTPPITPGATGFQPAPSGLLHQGPHPALLDIARRNEMDLENPGIRELINAASGGLTQFASETNRLRSEIAELRNRLDTRETTQAAQKTEELKKEIDGQAQSVRQEAFKTAVNGRIPDTPEFKTKATRVQAYAEHLVNNDQQLASYLDLAKQWAESGAKPQAENFIRLYRAGVNRHYLTAAKEELGEVVKTVEAQAAEDKARAEQTRIGLGTTAQGLQQDPNEWLKNQPYTGPEDAGRMAEQYMAMLKGRDGATGA